MIARLERKAERALAQYLRARVTGINIYEGSARAEEEQSQREDEEDEASMHMPALIILAQNSVPFGDSPPSSGIRSIPIQFQFQVDSTETKRAELDTWKSQTFNAVFDVAAVQTALNAPASGTDRREVKGIHFHDLIDQSNPSARQETDWIEDIQAEVVCEALTE